MEKRNVPKLRFKGFEDEWKISNLKNLCIINPKTKELPDKFNYIDLESIINGVLVKEKEIYLKDAPSRAQRVLEDGDVLFQTVRPYQMNNFIFENNSNKITVASTGYAQLRCNLKSYNKFIYQIIHNKKFNNRVMVRCTGTSYPAINSSELAIIPMDIPSLEEQIKIANFLSNVDNIIEEQEGKVKDLEQYKKGMMQKIFKQEIRFKDENGGEYPEWEEKKLGEVMFEPKKMKEENPIEIELLTVKLHCKGVELTGKYPNVTSNGRPYYKRFKDEILIGRQNMHNGGIGIVNEECDGKIASNAISSYRAIENNNIIYLLKYLSDENYYKRIDFLLGGTGQKEISKKELENLKIKLPCLEEQTKIANFLSNIDNIIKEENKKLEDLKLWKKGLLQQMFV